MRVAVIGANGFVGRHTCIALADAGHEVTAIIRRRDITELTGASAVKYMASGGAEAGTERDWSALLVDIDVVIHLISPSGKPEAHLIAEYSQVEADTLEVARSAAACGVTRLVFVSTIKVNGEESPDGPFKPDTPPRPETAYGKSKLETETGLAGISRDLGLPLTIVRPVAVHGSGSMGNIHLLVKLFSRLPGWMIPLAGIDNQRSFLHVENLSSALTKCVEDTSATNRLFLLDDGAPISTSTLCQLILASLGKPESLMRDPLKIVASTLALFRPDIARRLHGSLYIEDNGIRDSLGWEPKLSTAEGLKRTLANPRGGS